MCFLRNSEENRNENPDECSITKSVVMTLCVKKIHVVLIKDSLKGHILQVIKIDLSIVSRDETLNLRCGEHAKPFQVNDAAEAPNES